MTEAQAQAAKNLDDRHLKAAEERVRNLETAIKSTEDHIAKMKKQRDEAKARAAELKKGKP